MRHIHKLLAQHRFRILTVAFTIVTLLIGVVIVPIESKAENGNIDSVADGIWWSIGTMTSVGYGDHFPVTLYGRILGVILMFAGVMLIGLLVGLTTFSIFSARDELYWKRVLNRLDRIEDDLVSIKKKQNYLVKTQPTSDDTIDQ